MHTLFQGDSRRSATSVIPWTIWQCIWIGSAVLPRWCAVVRAVAAGIAFCVRSRCSSVARTLREHITSLNAVLHRRTSGVTRIEGFS